MNRTIGSIVGWMLILIGVMVLLFGGFIFFGAMGANPGGEGGLGVGVGIVGGLILIGFSLASFIIGRNILKDSEEEMLSSTGLISVSQRVKFALIFLAVLLAFGAIILYQYQLI